MAGSGTICALSSGGLPSGVAVIRISGPACRFVSETFCSVIPPRRAVLKAIRGRDGRIIDRGLVLFFPGPRSFTGEDVLELQVHGGPAVVRALLSELVATGDVRLAEPGEFSLRAFLNGRLDLTQVEALADLVAAETEAQRQLAELNASGAQRTLYEGWRRKLISIRAMIEAEIDFSDEAETAQAAATMRSDVASLRQEVENHLEAGRRGEIVREGYRVAILGAPNAGKSSLLNALARRDVAIVTDEPGTTRDVLEVALDLGGYKVIVSDTAGIRDDPGRVERIGIERAWAAAERADLVLWAIDLSNPAGSAPIVRGKRTLRIGTKQDLAPCATAGVDLGVSALSGEGLPALLDRIGQEAAIAGSATADVVPARLRHREHLAECLSGLVQAGDADALEIAAEHLRTAADSLGCITGAIRTEDLLDVIFSEFCLGK